MVNLKKIIWFISILVAILLAIPLIFSSIKQEEIKNVKIPWILDSTYSGFLTIDSSTYEFLSKKKIYKTVDGLRIYKIPQNRIELYNLEKLLKESFEFETTDKELIARFLDLTHEEIENPTQDCIRQNTDAYHVVAIDNTFMRVGYYIFSYCKVDKEEYIEIYPYINNEISIHYYNKALLPILREELNISLIRN